jgi:hypothetical protein
VLPGPYGVDLRRRDVFFTLDVPAFVFEMDLSDSFSSVPFNYFSTIAFFLYDFS